MRKHILPLLLVAALASCLTPPAFGVSKETIRMMEQLDNLQQSMQSMQKTVDTQTAVLRTLIEQTNENVSSMKQTIGELQKTNGENLAKDQNRFDQLTSQIQALSESLEEAKSRMAKLEDKVAQTQAIMQTLNAPPTNTQPGNAQPGNGQAAGAPSPNGTTGDLAPEAPVQTTRPAVRPARAVPDANSLYEQGLGYYNGGQYDLATQAFQQYLDYYSDTDLASNAQFYIGECYYSQENYKKAIDEYNKCLERYPTGNKLAAAQLKKGYALLALGQTQAGSRELHSLIERYPNSREADLARQRLKKVAATTPARKRAGA